MALARASRIQDKLNSNELKSDWPIWKHATPVLNCFRRALEIDSSNLSLWIEYGTMSYALHAFASRQLKQWRGDLPSELVQQVRGLAALLRTHRLPVSGAGVGLGDLPSSKHPKSREAWGARVGIPVGPQGWTCSGAVELGAGACLPSSAGPPW